LHELDSTVCRQATRTRVWGAAGGRVLCADATRTVVRPGIGCGRSEELTRALAKVRKRISRRVRETYAQGNKFDSIQQHLGPPDSCELHIVSPLPRLPASRSRVVNSACVVPHVPGPAHPACCWHWLCCAARTGPGQQLSTLLVLPVNCKCPGDCCFLVRDVSDERWTRRRLADRWDAGGHDDGTARRFRLGLVTNAGN